MKKETMLKSALILLPVLAVGLATTRDSVTVADPQAGTMLYGSYFSLLPVGGMQMFAPLAGLLCIAALILAVICVAAKKTTLIAAVKWTAFAAALAAVFPIILRGELLVIPNVGVPVFMGIEWFVAYAMAPKAETEPKKAKR